MLQSKIPENILEDILSRIDIVELIAGCIPLKRAGRNFRALCPFHHEKTPSFMVSPDRQIYHCFGCGKGGNAFGFLMEFEHLDFPEAVETLAKKAGVNLPKQSQDLKTTNIITQLYKINELTAFFYSQRLFSAEGARAKNYLLSRGIKQESIASFKLGYAPDKWDILINYLRSKNISLSLLEKAGLVIAKEGGGYYDRFRNRIIFPILDVKSRVIAFGARVLDDSLPKYMNSPETIIYSKSKNLYGLNLAKESIRENDFVAVTEGYLDFMIAYQEGLNNIVASLGTALTYEQVRLIKRYTQNVTMVYDADSAGELATLRTLDIFIEEGVNVKIASLPKGLDPDSFVRKFGITKFKSNIAAAEDLFNYKLKVLRARYDAKSIEDKARISHEMLLTINKFKNALLRSEYLKRLSEELRVDEDALLQEIKKIKEVGSKVDFYSNVVNKNININPTEKLLIKLMLEENELIERIKGHLEPADFQDGRVARIVSIMFDLASQGRDIEPRKLISHVEDEDTLRVICESSFLPEVSSQNRESIVEDCIKRLKNEKLKLKKSLLHEKIKNAQNLGDENLLDRLVNEFHHLIKESG